MGLFGCMLDFMHMLVMSVAEKAKSINKSGVFTYFYFDAHRGTSSYSKVN